MVHYCGKHCQRNGWENHKVLCEAINSLQNQRNQEIDSKCAFVSHISPEVKKRLVSLVGERCMVGCKIGTVQADVLWDTGAQVSLISKIWLKENNIRHEIKKSGRVDW